MNTIRICYAPVITTLLLVSISVNIAMWKGYIPTPPPIDWLTEATK